MLEQIIKSNCEKSLASFLQYFHHPQSNPPALCWSLTAPQSPQTLCNHRSIFFSEFIHSGHFRLVQLQLLVMARKPNTSYTKGKGKSDKLDHLNIFDFSVWNILRERSEATNGKEIFTNCVTNKWLIDGTHEELSKHEKKQSNRQWDIFYWENVW